MTFTHVCMAILLAMLLVSMPACRTAAPTAHPGTGAREVVQKYFDALKQQDWDTAYRCLDNNSQKQFNRAAFQNRAQIYCKQFDLSARNVVIRSCDEQGEKAIAQINLADAKGSSRHRIREGLVLHATAKGWAISLSRNFGSQ